MTLGTRFREARKAAGLSQKALGKVLGVEKAAVSNWERGKNEPTLTNTREAARELSVTVAWLINEEGEGPVPRAHRQAVEISKQLDTDQRADWFQVGHTLAKRRISTTIEDKYSKSPTA